jgi:parallel beta-helix repeat protein
MKLEIKSTAIVLLLSTICYQPSTARAQGNLTPPGAPALTMKALDQIEPRTIVNAANTPGDSTDSFIISQPGSYYLTSNLTGVSNKNGIEIITNNVTLDLNGFVLRGAGGNSSGIYAPAWRTNITVRNGTVTGWGYMGVWCYVRNMVVERVDASFNGQTGIELSGGMVRDCNCHNNGSYGIYSFEFSNASRISGCIAQSNIVNGIFAGTGTISDCTAVNNGGNGFYAISAVVSGCTALNNGYYGIIIDPGSVTGCISSGNTNSGILSFDNSTIKNCTVSYNASHGIEIGNGCQVLDCTSVNNASDGIHASGAGNRIDGNHVTGNSSRGIRLSSANSSIVVRNTATNNAAGDFPVAGSNIGPIQSPATSTSPWANFSF